MKYLKLFEEYGGEFIELTYELYGDNVMVDMLNGEIIDIYTSYDHSFDEIFEDEIKWHKGNNSLFVHCDNGNWYIILDVLLNSGDAMLLNYDDLDDDEPLEDEKYYDDLEDKMRKQAEILADVSKYNL